jgi:hypothetical protein
MKIHFCLRLLCFTCAVTNAAPGQTDGRISSAVTEYLREEVASSNAQKASWSSRNAHGEGITGGLIWTLLLPVNKEGTGEFIFLVQDVYGDSPRTANDSYTAYVLSKNGGIHRQDEPINEILGKRGFSDRTEYLERISGKDVVPELRAFTARGSKIAYTLIKRYPSMEEYKLKNDSLSVSEFERWAAEATAWPEGFKKFQPPWRWTPTAEFVRSEKPQWRPSSAAPHTKQDYDHLSATTPKVSWEEFQKWAKKRKAN